MPRPKRTRVGKSAAANNNTVAPSKKLPVAAAPAIIASDDTTDSRRSNSTRNSSARKTRSDDPARALRNSAQRQDKGGSANALPSKAASSPAGRAGKRAAVAADSRKRDNPAGAASDGPSEVEVEHSRHEPTAAARGGPRATAMALVDASGLDLDDDVDFGNLDDSLDDSRDLEEEELPAGHASSNALPSGYRSTDTSSFNTAMSRRGRPRASSIAGKDDAPIRPSSRAGVSTPGFGSTINLGLFRRRQREPSILGTARKPLRAAGRGQVPSSQQASEDEGGPTRSAGEESDQEDMDSDAEVASTPLDVTKPKGQSTAAAKVTGAQEGSRGESPASLTRKRKSLEEHESRGKRPARGEAASSDGDEGKEQEEEQGEPKIYASIEAASSPPVPRATRARASASDDTLSTPHADPDDNLDRLSIGSSSGSPVAWPSLEKLAHRHYNTKRAVSLSHRTPEPGNPHGREDDDNISNISSPPSLTHSPNFRSDPAPKMTAVTKPRAKKASAPAQKKLTTADLTSLLPRRRAAHKTRRHRNPNDPYDLSSDTPSGSDQSVDSENEADSDDHGRDELSYSVPRASRRRKAKGLPTPAKAPSATARGKQPQRQATTAATGSGAGAGATGATHGRKKQPPVRRTYGTHSSDKENEEGLAGGDDGGERDGGEEEEEEGAEESNHDDGQEDTESFADLTVTEGTAPQRVGEELKKAKAKFLEVDKWQLEFESVTESSSPMRDGR